MKGKNKRQGEMNEEENQRLLEDLSEAQQDLAEQKKKN